MAEQAPQRFATLTEMMDWAAEIVRGEIITDSFHENLLVQDPQGLIVAVLSVGPGRNQAAAVRLILQDYPEASFAVYTVQAWLGQVPPTHPLYAAVTAGKIPPSQLPPDLVKDIVLLIGESRDGEEAFRQYLVTPGAGSSIPPAMSREPMSTEGYVRQWNRFRPMFPQRHAAPSRHQVPRN